MKIAFIISSLGCGGAERVLSLMANYWAQLNYSIIVITLDNSTPFYLLEDGIKLEQLSLLKNSVSVFSAIANNITRIKIIRKKLIEIDPDIVISFMTETNIISTIGCKIINKPIIIAERISYDFLKSWVWVSLRKLVYRFSNALIVQTRYDKEKHNCLSNTFVINNPLNLKEMILNNNRAEKKFLAVGNLSRHKGFDRLIKAFSHLDPKDWNLSIIGEGSERSNLEKLIYDLNLEDYISMPGRTKAIGKWYKKSSIFVLSSRIEGFPNVLCEAMAYGCACISFDCIAGPNEIITDKVDGYLVKNGDINALSAKMDFLINNPEERRRIGKEAMKISDRLNIDSIMSKWDKIIEKILF
ncbi:MAG: glycosyltransferase family 4 protein [Cyclobacteriaceae bacterium]|nr:glycosyltransferase family 4 protein [Cyclobacteriaceae bacterium]